ncbi:MAG: type II secretion system protein [Longimicrobiales bacterium]
MTPAHPPSTNRRVRLRGQRGFTLVEMLTVMALLVVIMGIALPNIDVARFRLDGEVQSLALMINSSQRLAVLRQYDIVLAFDDTEQRIRLHHDTDKDGVVDTGEEVRFIQLEDEVVFGRGGANALPEGGANVTFTEVQDGLPSMTFRRNGSASENGVIYLTSLLASRAAGHSEHTRAIAIERATGQVTCMSYRTSSWEIGC